MLAVVVLIACLWAMLVALSGLLSQLNYLTGVFPWLSGITKMPSWLLSCIQGLLPPLTVSVLMTALPVILKHLIRKQGLPTGTAVQLRLQNYYFTFLFFQLFLIVSVSSSFSTLSDNLTNIANWPQVLAENIPKASNYFFSYMILQAMSGSASALVQIPRLIQRLVIAPLRDRTAREKWKRATYVGSTEWGTFLPVYSTLASIGKYI
jgi:hypothetical protein